MGIHIYHTPGRAAKFIFTSGILFWYPESKEPTGNISSFRNYHLTDLLETVRPKPVEVDT